MGTAALDCPAPSDARQALTRNDHEPGGISLALKFRQLPIPFAICKLAADSPIPEWALKGAFSSVTRSVDELSIVCPADNVPRGINSGSHWICLRLEGPFAFSQVGVLTSFIDPLAANRVPIFAISTFDTDYVLIQEEFAGLALQTLRQAGHELLGG